MKKKTKAASQGLRWPELIPGQLVRRYKRFLADVKLANGETVTAHCPNSGSMQACSAPDQPVYLSFHDNPKRKLKYTWELIQMPTSLVGVNTLVPNRLVYHSILNGKVAELTGYDTVKREVKVGTNSRLDLMLSGEGRRLCYVEVKNCTLVDDGLAAFPDAVTTRGRKHLVELQTLVAQGCRCAMFYLIQRMDARVFKPADHIDSAYGQALRHAVQKGVEVMVYDVRIDLQQIVLNNQVPYILT
jgi:sugar fermentation stimulation protein A